MNQAAGLSPEELAQAPWCAEAYRLRSGSWMASPETPFEEVMRQRFGDVHGRVRGPQAVAAQ